MQYLLMKSDEFRRLRRGFDLIEETGNLNVNHGSKLLHKFNQVVNLWRSCRQSRRRQRVTGVRPLTEAGGAPDVSYLAGTDGNFSKNQEWASLEIGSRCAGVAGEGAG